MYWSLPLVKPNVMAAPLEFTTSTPSIRYSVDPPKSVTVVSVVGTDVRVAPLFASPSTVRTRDPSAPETSASTPTPAAASVSPAKPPTTAATLVDAGSVAGVAD